MADNNSGTRWMPTAGGVLNIISGIFGLISSIFLGFFASIFKAFIEDPDHWNIDYQTYEALKDIPAGFWWFLVIVTAILSIVALIGGIFAVQRKGWGLALTGSICAILQNGILGIISTIFVALSRKEFTS